MFLLKALKKNSFLSLSSYNLIMGVGNPICSLTYRPVTEISPISVSVFTQLDPLYVYMSMFKLTYSGKDSSHIRSRAHPNPIWPHLSMNICNDYF